MGDAVNYEQEEILALKKCVLCKHCAIVAKETASNKALMLGIPFPFGVCMWPQFGEAYAISPDDSALTVGCDSWEAAEN